ncbi:MAG: hypothetical protein M0Z25_09865 [Nitrospiraceae bacterium]|nr:hypothetical protein [Nitrospiraceae bacterium]
METLPHLAKSSPAECQDPAALSEKSGKGSRHDPLSKILRGWSTEILARHLLPFLFPPLPLRALDRCHPPARRPRRGKEG